MTNDKVRENRLRRAAARQGLRLEKSRRRDPRALDFGAWWLVDAKSGGIVFGRDGAGAGVELANGQVTSAGPADLDAIEAWLHLAPVAERFRVADHAS